jgi:ABC-type Fe2+-enterobactin transport system substrate-binding protein
MDQARKHRPMRIVLTAVMTVGFLAGVSAPALASANVPVTVTGEANNGVCVTVSVSDPVKQCIDLGQP